MIALHRVEVSVDPNNVVVIAVAKGAVPLHFEKSDRYFLHFLAEDATLETEMRKLIFAEISTRGIQPSTVLTQVSGQTAQYLGFAGRYHAWII